MKRTQPYIIRLMGKIVSPTYCPHDIELRALRETHTRTHIQTSDTVRLQLSQHIKQVNKEIPIDFFLDWLDIECNGSEFSQYFYL